MSREVGYLGHSIDIVCLSHVVWTLLKYVRSIATSCLWRFSGPVFLIRENAIDLLRAHGAYVLSFRP